MIDTETVVDGPAVVAEGLLPTAPPVAVPPSLAVRGAVLEKTDEPDQSATSGANGEIVAAPGASLDSMAPVSESHPPEVGGGEDGLVIPTIETELISSLPVTEPPPTAQPVDTEISVTGASDASVTVVEQSILGESPVSVEIVSEPPYGQVNQDAPVADAVTVVTESVVSEPMIDSPAITPPSGEASVSVEAVSPAGAVPLSVLPDSHPPAEKAPPAKALSVIPTASPVADEVTVFELLDEPHDQSALPLAEAAPAAEVRLAAEPASEAESASQRTGAVIPAGDENQEPSIKSAPLLGGDASSVATEAVAIPADSAALAVAAESVPSVGPESPPPAANPTAPSSPSEPSVSEAPAESDATPEPRPAEGDDSEPVLVEILSDSVSVDSDADGDPPASKQAPDSDSGPVVVIEFDDDFEEAAPQNTDPPIADSVTESTQQGKLSEPPIPTLDGDFNESAATAPTLPANGPESDTIAEVNPESAAVQPHAPT
jgi:hypothetical protein